jgi:hypothetical protein
MSLLRPIDGNRRRDAWHPQAGTRTVRIEPRSGHRACRGTRSTCPLPDAGEQPVDEITGLALPEHPGLAQFGLRPFTKLELGHRNRPVLAVALGRLVIGESAPQEDIESFPDDRRMRAGQRMAKGCDDGAEPVWGMLDAIDQVMGVLALEALVEREGLQAGEADDVRVLDASRWPSRSRPAAPPGSR